MHTMRLKRHRDKIINDKIKCENKFTIIIYNIILIHVRCGSGVNKNDDSTRKQENEKIITLRIQRQREVWVCLTIYD